MKHPTTIPLLDLPRYMGTWYELDRTDFEVERGCQNSISSYSLTKDGKIRIVQTCTVPTQRRMRREATAWIEREEEPGVLGIHFEGTLRDKKGYYYIHWTDYDHFAVIGSPGGNVWILGRKKQISRYELEALRSYIQRLGYNGTLQVPEDVTITNH